MHLTRRLVPGLVAGSLLAGSVSGALAAKQHKASHAFVYGQVSNVSASSFTLAWTTKAKAGAAATQKSASVTLAAGAKEAARKGTTGPLTNGEYALVIGTKTASGITARRVVYSATAFNPKKMIALARARAILAARHHVVGTVNGSQTTAASLVITTKRGKTRTFSITAATKFFASGQQVATAPTLTNGETVGVFFKRDAATKTLMALRVNVRPGATTP